VSHFKRHRVKTAPRFTQPKRELAPERTHCAWCSMPATNSCELPSCRVALCGKHLVRKAGGVLCPNHKNAILVQYDGLPSDRFGDRGEAHAIALILLFV